MKGVAVPPSVTVRFCRINKKDSVLRGYKNYDAANKKPRQTRVYQSLSSHYSDLRRAMYTFFGSKPDSRDFGDIRNTNLNVKWITYQSPSSGFAFKTQSGDYFNGIHTFSDFAKAIYDKYPACRVA